MDDFPEVFSRFEQDDFPRRMKEIRSWSFDRLRLEFEFWLGDGWKDSHLQRLGLAREAEKRGIDVPELWTKGGIVLEKKERPAEVERKPVEVRFSRAYVSFDVWLEKATRTTAYQRRIISYVRLHPNSSLSEARGHAKKR